ncbi:MAG: TetR/AcrR family transcriptional regulator [Pseudomonadota bacterium]
MPGSETKRDKATAKRRAQILEAAVMCFLENGYHQTGVREIAKRAGISLGNLYNHFNGKHDVLAEIATIERRELGPILDLLGKDEPADEVLKQFLEAYVRSLSEPEIVILTLEITCEAMRKPDIAELFSESRVMLVTSLARLIDRGVAEKTLRPVPDTEETAYLILELIEGSSYRIAIDDAPLERVLRNLIALVMSSLVLE